MTSFRLTGLGKGCEPPQIAEQHGDVATVAVNEALIARRHDQFCNLRGHEALEAANALNLAELICDPRFECLVPRRQFHRLFLYLVM